ncbi:MAG: hypothetical protein MUO19_00070 [Dehalococcoidales bacterium]|nr:hypothetical protein [Dehalococcoidales bacterium]
MKKNIGLRIILGIAGIGVGLIVQVVGALIIKVMDLESVIINGLIVLLGFVVMGYCVYKWAIK